MRIIAFVVILFFSCQSINNQQKIEYIEVFYLKEELLYPMRIDCAWMSNGFFEGHAKQKKITDRKFIDQFSPLYYKLKKSPEQRKVDVRMQVIVHLESSETDTICMGEYFNITVNDITMEDSPKFLKLLKDKVYDK